MTGPGTARYSAARERRLADTFVALADTLTADFDLAAVHRRLVEACVDVLGAAAAGLSMTGPGGALTVVAATTDAVADLEALEVTNAEGPCHECFSTGTPVPGTDLAASHARWPRFTPAALAAGYSSVRALPLHLRGQVIGALNLFGDDRTDIADEDVRIAQALADVATIALLQHRAVAEGDLVADQLRNALATRVVVEQAKGMLAERGGIDVDAAFERLRTWARSRRAGVSVVARDLVEGRLGVDDVLRDA